MVYGEIKALYINHDIYRVLSTANNVWSAAVYINRNLKNNWYKKNKARLRALFFCFDKSKREFVKQNQETRGRVYETVPADKYVSECRKWRFYFVHNAQMEESGKNGTSDANIGKSKLHTKRDATKYA